MKKIRLPVWQMVLALLVVSGSLAVLISVACDYLRLHGINGRNFALLRHTKYQRDNLIGAQDDLRAKINSFLAEGAAQQALHEELENKLDELSKFIQDSKAIPAGGHTVKSDWKIVRSNDDKLLNQAVGGLEKSCGRQGCKVLEQDLLPSDSSIADQPDARASLSAQPQAVTDNQLLRLSDMMRVLRAIPLLVPVRGDLSSGFGFRWSPFEHAIAKHEGLDFSAEKGTAVGSAGDGVVKAVKRDGTYGLVIDIEHTPRITTRYAHLSSALVTEGEKIIRGDLIGQVGSTGRSTGPHLHYEVLVDGNQIDPEKYIQLAGRLNKLMS